ncbi:Uncharacterised protein [uncultured archaeon]|nr:Uncharacterised protein [uncultured archaeon]
MVFDKKRLLLPTRAQQVDQLDKFIEFFQVDLFSQIDGLDPAPLMQFLRLQTVRPGRRWKYASAFEAANHGYFGHLALSRVFKQEQSNTLFASGRIGIVGARSPRPTGCAVEESFSAVVPRVVQVHVVPSSLTAARQPLIVIGLIILI